MNDCGRHFLLGVCLGLCAVDAHVGVREGLSNLREATLLKKKKKRRKGMRGNYID